MALDPTHILGRGAVKDTYNLLADGILQVLRALAKLASCDLLELAEEVCCARYVQGPSLKGQADVDWTDPNARQRFLAEIVKDAEQPLDLARGTRSDLTKDTPEDQEWVAAAALLARILGQDIERDENGPRLKRGVATDRLISVHDPEMRYGRKSSSHRFNGHKAQVAVDSNSQMITAVGVLAGNALDAERALEAVQASEAATEYQPAETAATYCARSLMLQCVWPARVGSTSHGFWQASTKRRAWMSAWYWRGGGHLGWSLRPARRCSAKRCRQTKTVRTASPMSRAISASV